MDLVKPGHLYDSLQLLKQVVPRKHLAQAGEIVSPWSDLMNTMGCNKRAFKVKIDDLSIEETKRYLLHMWDYKLLKKKEEKLSKNFHSLLETDSCI